ncbi:MAG TPA: outer membrane lipid asymmetry maintenance protein MlaD [Paracoccaceae bacterium]|nr:outer membrane lipid asymmetry maintenance protein MlaD [Paracoccaceae bacterium]
MRENVTETVVGAVVVAVAAGFMWYAAGVSGMGSGGNGYELTAEFRSAEGVTVGTDIRMAGVKVGTVTGLALDPNTFRAQATLSINEGIPVPDDSTAIVSSEGLLGGNFVEIVPGGSFDNYAEGAQILDTQGSISVVQLLLKFVTGGEDK